MTNLEAVRTMEPEALACILMCPRDIDDTVKRDKKCEMGANCIRCTMDWLGQEEEVKNV